MRILAVLVIACTLLSIGCNIEKSDYDAGIEAYKRGHYTTALYDFEKRANQGDPVAQFCLGFMYKYGKGVGTNEEKAKEWYTKAAEQGYTPAMNNLAVIYYAELMSLESNKFLDRIKKARRLFTEAANNNDPTAQTNLALMNVLRPEEAKKWYKRAAEQEYAPAQLMLGTMYQIEADKEWANGNTETAEELYEEVLLWYQKSAKPRNENSPIAHSDFAVKLGDGWYEIGSRKKGYAIAQNALAQFYRDKASRTEDESEAIEYLKEAVKMLTQAAKQGYPSAQTSLAFMFHYGIGVNKNLAEAKKWYINAVSQNNISAVTNLALLYPDDGIERERLNDEIVVRLTLTSAQSGEVIAQSNVAYFFEKGKHGLPQSNVEAYYWYSLALQDKESLNETAYNKKDLAAEVEKKRNRIGEKLLDVEKNKIHERVKNWHPMALVSAGTGFYVNESHILTNAHVVRDKKKEKFDEIRVNFSYAKEKEGSVDRDVDLALLAVDPVNALEKRNTFATFRNDKNPIQRGEEIVLFGYPLTLSHNLSYEGNTTSGEVSGLLGPILLSDSDIDASYLFQHTAPQQSGNSGGPVFDSTGNVIGVSVSGIDDTISDNVSFPIRTKVIKEFLGKHLSRDKFTVESNTKAKNIKNLDKVTRQRISENAKKFTVPVWCFKKKEEKRNYIFEIGLSEAILQYKTPK